MVDQIDPTNVQLQDVNQIKNNPEDAIPDSSDPINVNEGVQDLLINQNEVSEEAQDSLKSLLTTVKVDPDIVPLQDTRVDLTPLDEKKIESMNTIFNTLDIGKYGNPVTDDDLQTVEHIIEHPLDAPVAVADDVDELEALIEQTPLIMASDEEAGMKGHDLDDDYKGQGVPILGAATLQPYQGFGPSAGLSKVDGASRDHGYAHGGFGETQHQGLDPIKQSVADGVASENGVDPKLTGMALFAIQYETASGTNMPSEQEQIEQGKYGTPVQDIGPLRQNIATLKQLGATDTEIAVMSEFDSESGYLAGKYFARGITKFGLMGYLGDHIAGRQGYEAATQGTNDDELQQKIDTLYDHYTQGGAELENRDLLRGDTTLFRTDP